MFVGGCAGSTGGGMKVIRHVLFAKVLWLEIEQSYHPAVVRHLRYSGRSLEAEGLRKHILVYFGAVLGLFVFSWLSVLAIEGDAPWVPNGEEGPNMIYNKLLDSASAVIATLNNIGPGVGVVGATQNYAVFSPAVKLLFTLLMIIGRLEVFVILVLFAPRFWQNR